MSDIRRVVITPRWSGTPDSDWYPWVARQLGEPPVHRIALPEPSAPTLAGCVDAFGAALDAGEAAGTLCVGHSVSVQGWLRALAARPERRVAGLLAVAGWWTVDEPWPSIRPWVDTPHDLVALRRACPAIHVLLGTGDPFTADHEANARRWREDAGAEVTVVPGGKHFNAPEEPAVLAALRRWLSA